MPELGRVAALALSLVPPALSWWSGGRLRRLDDPAFAERLQLHRRYVAVTTIAALAAAGVLDFAFLVLLDFGGPEGPALRDPGGRERPALRVR